MVRRELPHCTRSSQSWRSANRIEWRFHFARKRFWIYHRRIHNRVKAKLGALSYIPAELLLIQLGPRLGVPRDELCPIKHLPDVGCPVFIASGMIDEHTTAEETQAMFAAAMEPKELWLVNGAAHVDLYDFATLEYRTHVFQFLDRNLGQ